MESFDAIAPQLWTGRGGPREKIEGLEFRNDEPKLAPVILVVLRPSILELE